MEEFFETFESKFLWQFSELTDFFPVSKYVIVRVSNLNPCQYSVPTLLGQGLRDKDYIR